MEFNNLEEIDINNRDRNLTNPEIYLSINELLNCEKPYFDIYGDKLDNETRFLMICRDSSYITDEGLLNRVIELILSFLNSEELSSKFVVFLDAINGKYFTVEELIKIKAIAFSLLSYYELKTKIRTPPGITPPQLDIYIVDENKLICHNLTFVENIVDRNYFIAFVKHQETLPFEEAIVNYDDAIKSNRYFGYKRDTDVSAKTIRLLQEEKKELIKRSKAKTKAPQQKAPIIEKEKVPVIALLYYYNGQYITRDNAQSIANKYGYNAKTSGEGLYQDFVYYAENTNRKASGENRIKCNNRIKNQNRVIELLIDENAKSKAITELNVLKTKLENLS